MKAIFCLAAFALLTGDVKLGVDCFFTGQQHEPLRKCKIGLITNHTSINREGMTTARCFATHGCTVAAFFSPEHGISGKAYAAESVDHKNDAVVPIHSLYGENRRPTEEQLKGVDVLVFDIQDIGVRSYTYISTLFYCMEEAAKKGMELYVFDRPNPIGGTLIDGPMLEEGWRSFIGYVNIPYCHGMTVGELAQFFNQEYKIGCKLHVVPMEGWKRGMHFSETGLRWVPTSPHIPEADTPLYTATTGLVGELGIVNIGVGYTLPFKVVGAPWITAETFAAELNKLLLPGVSFLPFHYRPFYGKSKGVDCGGVLIQIVDRKKYRPLDVQYALMGILKSLYPEKVMEALKGITPTQRDLFCKAFGSTKLLETVEKEKFPTWKLLGYDTSARETFMKKRSKYLLYN